VVLQDGKGEDCGINFMMTQFNTAKLFEEL